MTSPAWRRIANSPGAPAAARRYVGEVLAGDPAEVVDAVALMVSELATNCVRYADTDLSVSVERQPGRVRVDVADGSGGAPRLRNPGPSDTTGRGLRIVQQLSDEWGVHEHGDRRGKSVWFFVRA